ncbi:MAG TPA: chromosome segregation protein SMC [Acidimicrobiales bacterium]|nr:chromosome segregation protein SMC [Acidimicrobiales bacterium]
MFLKSLTLKGFKSFAEPTTLELEPGITVVVGPNGSGKSNVVDAVAWVLGAQGPRTVRSSKMEDVIFAGSSKRPALGRAEVSLTIDNSAGLLPIDFSEITITRTLFRSGDSEYALNGVPCRLLDVQELLSDTGVGRQQHVIVSQGQLAAILDARPEDRRGLVEEAAGVLKYRRRREKAQRRLESTEVNLARLQDLLREVRRQLRPLERQAEAARRHGSLVEELRAFRLHVAGRELAGLQGRLVSVTSTTAELAAAEVRARAELAHLDTAVAGAEVAVSAAGADDLGDTLTRFEALRERSRGMAALLAERQRSVERELRATLDEGVVASLEAEAAGLAHQLQAVEADAVSVATQAGEVAAAEAAVLGEAAALELQWGDGEQAAGGVAAAVSAAEVRGELAALRRAVTGGRAELARLESRAAVLVDDIGRISAELDELGSVAADAERDEHELAPRLAAAGAARSAADDLLAAAETEQRAAEQDHQTWSARVEALTLALDASRARAGVERLGDVAGVVGTLLELVEVDPGWQAAFEAAVGEAVAAVMVDNVASARRALARLKSEGATSSAGGGAVLPIMAGAISEAERRTAAELVAACPATGLRSHVRSVRPGMSSFLDTLLARAVAVDGGWEQTLDVAVAHPGLIVVNRDGDRFSATGWRAGTSSTGATGAALHQARTGLAASAEKLAGVEERVTSARQSAAQARAGEAEITAGARTASTRLAAATEASDRLEAEQRHVRAENDRLAPQLAELAGRLQVEEARVAHLEAALPALEAEEAAGAQRVLSEREARERLEQRRSAVRALRTDLEVRAGGLEERRALLSRRQVEVEERLSHHAAERAEAGRRRVELESRAVATARLASMVAAGLTEVEAALGAVREDRARHVAGVRAATERLDGLRRQRTAAERGLAELRERAQRAEMEKTEVRLRLETATETLRRELDCEPATAIAATCPELPPGTSAVAKVRELERELRLMGPVNPLALEEFTALQERHQFLESQLEDVRQGRRVLSKVIRAVDEEIVQVFSAAYADVAENFTALFTTLFPGGTGRLSLTEPDNLLETGIEIEARPSGKNVRKLSLLSGGERSLAALAFLFAVFRSRPSPFYLMDEVEAALDDVNLHRFIDLLHEFRGDAQLLVVTHQKRTMEAADCLYGVTMQPGGSSRVISERIPAATA